MPSNIMPMSCPGDENYHADHAHLISLKIYIFDEIWYDQFDLVVELRTLPSQSPYLPLTILKRRICSRMRSIFTQISVKICLRNAKSRKKCTKNEKFHVIISGHNAQISGIMPGGHYARHNTKPVFSGIMPGIMPE